VAAVWRVRNGRIMLTGTNELGQVGAIPLWQTCSMFVRLFNGVA
jgi:hypothetical protein